MKQLALKAIASAAFLEAFGCIAFHCDITLLEANEDGSYIRFKIKNNTYNIINDTLALLDPENNEVMIWTI